MTLAVWPVSVNNNALRGSYRSKPERWNVDSFQVEEGPPLEGINSTTSTDAINYNLKLTAAEWATLQTFWRDASTGLSSGVDYFTMTDPLSGSTITCKFIEPPDLQAVNSVKYQVGISVRKFNY